MPTPRREFCFSSRSDGTRSHAHCLCVYIDHWGPFMNEYAECRTQALKCLVELQREDLPKETRELLEWMANQWLVLAAERAILDGFDGSEARPMSQKPH